MTAKKGLKKTVVCTAGILSILMPSLMIFVPDVKVAVLRNLLKNSRGAGM